MTVVQEPDIRKAVEAIRHGRGDELLTLLTPELVAARGKSLLRYACRIGQVECIRALMLELTRGKAREGRMLHALCTAGRARYFASVVSVFGREGLCSGAVPVVHRFARVGDTAAVQALVNEGVDTEIRDRDGMTPLMAAAYKGRLDCARRLVQMGANVNAQDKFGNTPLMAAVSANCPALVRFLLEHGANADMKDRGGRTAMDDAARAFRPRCRAILAQHQTLTDE